MLGRLVTSYFPTKYHITSVTMRKFYNDTSEPTLQGALKDNLKAALHIDNQLCCFSTSNTLFFVPILFFSLINPIQLNFFF